MEVTESGMAMLANALHPMKAPALMLVQWVSATVVSADLVGKQDRKPTFGTVMIANELHCSNAPSPMLATESGMVMLANELQYSKASISMAVAESGMVMLANELQ